MKKNKKIIGVEFPAKAPLEDYHDGPYVAEILSHIVGQPVINEELEFKQGEGYWFQFDIEGVEDF